MKKNNLEDMINTIQLGDCYKLIKDIPDKSIDLVYIDIPYLIESGGTGSSSVAKRIHKLNYETLKDIRNGIDYSIFDELCRIMKHIFIYIWCSKEQIHDIMTYFIEKKECRFNLLV
jgi:DNA modification methylase